MIHIFGKTASSILENVQKEDVQPNAVDLRLGKVFSINKTSFFLDENVKCHRGTTEVLLNEEGYWTLNPGTYEIVMENTIQMGKDEAGWVITRSTLIRNGCFIASGLYDSGYKGSMVAALYITCGPLVIKKGTRIGQFLLFKSESLHQYDGSYGIDKEHDKKYM
jgi:deoxycytidine triphosphate deaminase